MRRSLFFLRSFLLLCTLVASLFLAPHVQADENFATTLHTTYWVAENGRTTIEHKLTFTNKTPALYIKQYAVKITTQNELSQVTVASNGQALTPNVVKGDRYTSIGISFPDVIVGEGQKREVVIRYQSKDFSTTTGKVLEVNVPALAAETSYDNYRVTLVTPTKYGFPTRVSPPASTVADTNDGIVTEFNNVQNTGISSLYGSFQLFQFTLRYNLENTTNNAGLAQIALPPDTRYQRIHFEELSPYPLHMETDNDGNWIATYQLQPNQQMTVNAQGFARIALEPDPLIPNSPAADNLTQPQPFWESTDSSVKDLAKKYQTPREIYTYVVDNLTYPTNLPDNYIERLGATGTLAQPTQATCQEFTDLFIAMARANNIPARRVTGYAYTQNNALRPLSLVADVLHAWPEYYDRDTESWIPIDPTWANTTGGVNYFDQLDLNHFAFAINGASSTTPYPAGSYKLTNQDSKDVEVTFADSFPTPELEIEWQLHAKKFLGISIPGSYELEIINLTGQAWYNTQTSLSAAAGRVHSNLRAYQNSTILPFSRKRITVELTSDKWWQITPTKLTATLAIANQNEVIEIPYTTDVIAGPYFLNYFFDPTSLVGLGIGSCLLALIAGSVLVLRRRSARAVRRQSKKLT